MDVLHKFSKIRSAYWYSSFSVLWLLIIALQWIKYGDGIWYKETSVLILTTIGIVAVCQLLLPRYTRWKWIVKTIAILIAWVIISIRYDIYVPVENTPLKEQITTIFNVFAPYFWFSVSAWIVFEFLLNFMHSIRNILFIVGASIIAFSILDSFSEFYLWTHVAWTVFASLGWLVCLHLRQFQLKFPKGWGQLRKQPIRILADIIFTFACVLLIGINMPEVSPTLTDPYTAWISRDQGATTGGTGEGGNGTSGAQGEGPSVSSGYGRDDTSLGGSFDFNYETVFQVESSVKNYWRGETRLTYSGEGWTDIDDKSGTVTYSSGELPEAESARKLKTREVQQTFTMQTNRKYPVLFGAYSMRQVQLQDDRENAPNMKWQRREAELYWHGYEGDQRQIDFPRKYKVTSEVPIVPVDELAKQSYDQLYPQQPPNRYLQLPSSLPNRVVDLAASVSKEGKTPYDKVVLLRDYLRSTYRYSNRPDLTLKQSDDFVEGFLFEIKEGYCDYFSTSLVVLARSQGIPARWVKGFAPGSLTNVGVQNGESRTVYQVTNADAHSWAEIYFGEDYGWVTFEATPGFNAPELTAQQNNQEQEIKPEEEQQQEENQVKTQPKQEEPSFIDPTVGVIIMISAILIVVLWPILRFREVIYYGVLGLRKGHALSFGDKVIHSVMVMVKRLKRKGYGWNESQTLREAFEVWSQYAPASAPKLALILQKFEKGSYSPDSITEQEWRLIQSLTVQVLKEMKSVS